MTVDWEKNSKLKTKSIYIRKKTAKEIKLQTKCKKIKLEMQNKIKSHKKTKRETYRTEVKFFLALLFVHST